MFLAILLILPFGLFFLILLLLLTPVKIGFQSKPFLLTGQFFFLRFKLSANLDLQISFLNIKKKIVIRKLFEEIFQKKMVGIFQKIFTPQKTSAAPQTTTQQTEQEKVKKNWKHKPNRRDLLELGKIFFLYFSIRKIDLRIAWEECSFLGVLYGFRVLLPPTYQKKLHFSFYKQSSCQLAINFYLGKFLLQTIYWYCKLFLRSTKKKI